MKTHLFYLDFIRVVAAFLVIIFHFICNLESMQLIQNPNDFIVSGVNLFNLGGKNLTLGNWAVSLFFIVTGASLMYAYECKFDIASYYKKRIMKIMPMYYICYILACIWLIISRQWVGMRPVWTLSLTVLGLDGWLSDVLPTHPLVGDWFIGCVLVIYLIFPLYRKLMNKVSQITILGYALFFIIFEFLYPWNFPERNSVLLRSFEVLFGMFCIKEKLTWGKKSFCFSSVVIGIIYFIRLSGISPYILTPIAGISAYIVLSYLSVHIHKERIRTIFEKVGYYTFPVFLVHHFLLNQVMGSVQNKSLNFMGTLLLFAVCLPIIISIAVIINKSYIFLTDRLSRRKN